MQIIWQFAWNVSLFSGEKSSVVYWICPESGKGKENTCAIPYCRNFCVQKIAPISETLLGTCWEIPGVSEELLTLKMPRKPAYENVVCWIFLQTFQTYFCIKANSVDSDQTAKKTCIWKCHLFMLSAEYSCKLFKPIFAYRQTVWTLIRLLWGAVWSGSILFAKMTFKITSRWQSRRQLLWLAV